MSTNFGNDFEDVKKESEYWGVDYSESVSELEDDGYVAVDISEWNKSFIGKNGGKHEWWI